MLHGYVPADLAGKVNPALVEELQAAHDDFAAAQIRLGRLAAAGSRDAGQALRDADAARKRWTAVQRRIASVLKGSLPSVP